MPPAYVIFFLGHFQKRLTAIFLTLLILIARLAAA
jgi:hypothetical protein